MSFEGWPLPSSTKLTWKIKFEKKKKKKSQKKPWFLCICSVSLLKTLWEMEKLVMLSKFSFSQSVFYLFRELSSFSIKYEIVERNFFQFGRV